MYPASKPDLSLENIRKKIEELSKFSPNLQYTQEELKARRKYLQSRPQLFRLYGQSNSPEWEAAKAETAEMLKEKGITFIDSCKFIPHCSVRTGVIKNDGQKVNSEKTPPESSVNATQPLQKMEKAENQQELNQPQINTQFNAHSNQSETSPINSIIQSNNPEQQYIRLQVSPLGDKRTAKVGIKNDSISSTSFQPSIIQREHKTEIKQSASNQCLQIQIKKEAPIQNCNPTIDSHSKNHEEKNQLEQPKQIRTMETISQSVQPMRLNTINSNKNNSQKNNHYLSTAYMLIFKNLTPFVPVQNINQKSNQQNNSGTQLPIQINKNSNIILSKQVNKVGLQQQSRL